MAAWNRARSQRKTATELRKERVGYYAQSVHEMAEKREREAMKSQLAEEHKRAKKRAAGRKGGTMGEALKRGY